MTKETIISRKIKEHFDESGKEVLLRLTDEHMSSGIVRLHGEDYQNGVYSFHTIKYWWPSGAPGVGQPTIILESFNDEPASIVRKPDGSVLFKWAVNNELDRKRKPAVIEVDCRGNASELYYRNGILSRPEGGEAIEYKKAKPLPGFKP